MTEKEYSVEDIVSLMEEEDYEAIAAMNDRIDAGDAALEERFFEAIDRLVDHEVEKNPTSTHEARKFWNEVADRASSGVAKSIARMLAGEPEKVVTILIGIPASGKSTWASQQEGATVVNADRYHIGADGVYRYRPAQAGKAHLWCYRAFLDALERGDEHVIVDNTNTQNWERSPYVKHAQLLGYTVEFKRFRCAVDVAASRNVHSVPREIVEKMAVRIEEPFARWGEVEEIETDTGDA